MKRFVFVFVLLLNSAVAQISCVKCYDQNTPITTSVTNLILNGGFETHTCGSFGYFCPNSSMYSCDITNWTCTGGATDTYAQMLNNGSSIIVEGLVAAYLGNSFCEACTSTIDDTSCIGNSICETTGIPTGYPVNGPTYGGTTGVSLSQTVNGLVVGNCYILEFWVGGEAAFSLFRGPGLFAVDIGFGNTFFRNGPTAVSSSDLGTRYLIEFVATNTSHTVKFTNWGHICSDCTELIVDDVKLYLRTELPSNITPCNVTCDITPQPPTPVPCSLKDSLDIPNVFTPNADGKNDSLFIDFECSVVFTIYNRWGNIIFETKGTQVAWDGRSKKDFVSDGVYYYVAVGDGKTYKGFVHLIK